MHNNNVNKPHSLELPKAEFCVELRGVSRASLNMEEKGITMKH